MFRASLCPKHFEILLITNKSLFAASSWFLFYLLIITLTYFASEGPLKR